MKKTLLLSFTLLCTFYVYSQDFSNKGKEFWLAYSYHVGMSGGSGTPVMNLYITSDVNTTYTVEIFGGAVISTGTITANVMTAVNIPNTYFINDDGLFITHAIHVTAPKPIVVYSFITRNAASAATLCLPANVLGKQYYAMSFTQISNENNANSYITIIAAEDNTSVEIIPTANTKGGWLAGSVNTVNLSKGEVYQVLGTTTGNTGVDLSGTSVRSISSGINGCKRIAVFSGSGKLSIGGCGGSADNLYQQLYPAATWGKKYLTVPSFNNPNNYFRIMRSDPAANVTLNGTAIPAASFTNGYYQFINNIPNLIESDLPISVTQYFTTSGCLGNSAPYDPDMIELNPVEQNISSVTLASSPLTPVTQEHHLHVIIPNGGPTSTSISSFLLDGTPVPANLWTVHPADPNYSYLYLTVTQGSHSLYSDTGFNAIAYGYATFETYGYSAGTNVKDLYQRVGVQTLYGIETSPSVCTGSPFKFKLSLPYKPDSMYWDFHGFQLPNVLVNSPTPVTYDSTTLINGKIIYWYSLPGLYNYNIPGSYAVTVTTYLPNSDGCGNVQQIDFDLEVTDPPVADFDWTTTVCAGGTVQFNDQTPVIPKPTYKWWWNFGDPGSGTANTSNLKNPTHTYTTAGTYTVKYSSVTTPGCLSDTLSKTITIHPFPTAAISGNNSICQNASAPNITFTGAVGTAPYTFTYNINGGPNLTVTSIAGNSVTVAVPTNIVGTYIYTLVSVGDAGIPSCSQLQSGTATVIIRQLPTAAISGTTAVCLNAPAPNITFSAAAGTAPYTFTYTINGGTNLTVTTTAGSSVTVAVPTSTAGTFLYSLISVQDATSSLCSQSQTGTATVTVNPRPTATISGTTALCLNSPQPLITFTGAGATAPYTFTYTINGGPAQTVTTTAGNFVTVAVPTNTAGTFTYQLVSVKDASVTQCSQAQAGSAVVTVYPLPTADFSITPPTCQVKTVIFSDLSVANAGSLSTWTWSFGDPASGPINNSAVQSPTHTFTTAGNFTINLSVTTSFGCVNSPVLTRLITVNPRPHAGFIDPQVCLSDTYAQFTDTSTVTSGSITAWQWNFGDPASGPLNTSTVQNPQHSYNSVGTKDVTLIVTSNNGCRDTILQSFIVNGDIPIANFSVNNSGSLCVNDTVSIANLSTVNVGSIIREEIYWDNVGQPAVFDTYLNPVSGDIFKHLYPNFQAPLTKNFTIRFRAYSGATCINDKYITITVNAAPKVLFNAMPNTCMYIAPFQITQASETGGVPGTFVFSGPGVSATGMFDPVAAGPGIKTIKYLFTSSAGCVDSVTQTITVLQPPVADFTISTPPCQNETLTLNGASSSSLIGTLTTWAWDFGDGSPVDIETNNNPVTHIYTTTGSFDIKLMVTTSDGCISLTKTKTVIIKPQPHPDFTFSPSACLPDATIQFTSASTIADGTENSFTYLWNFDHTISGTLNSSFAQNPTHTYFALGPYNVTLLVTSGAGCRNDTTIAVNSIFMKPTADFDFSSPSVCIKDEVTFHDLSNPQDGVTQTWHWNFGDGVSPPVTESDPSHTYLSIGSYDVSLYIVNSHTCHSDTITQIFHVYPYPTVDAGPDRFVLQGGSIVIVPAVTGNDLHYMWTPHQYLNDYTLANPTCTPNEDITYTLVVSAQGGCSDSDKVFIKVLMAPLIPNTFTPNNDRINDKWNIKYLDTYPQNKVQVFTRTGQLVFESRGYKEPWDGTMGGKPLPIDTYYYIIEPGNGRKPITGYVTILK